MAYALLELQLLDETGANLRFRRGPSHDTTAICTGIKEIIMHGKTLTLLVALSLSGGAFAQDSTNTAQSTDNKTRSQVDNTSNSTRTNQQSSNDENVPTKNGSTTTASSGDFDSLDKKHNGYLVPSDVSTNKKLSANFKTCDKNHDGRLSRDEYSNCSSGM